MGAAQPVQHVVVRLPDEARVKHERVTVGVLQATDMAHGPDTIRARLDDRQAILLSRLMNDAGPGGATPPIVRVWGRSPGAHDPRLARPRAQRGRHGRVFPG
jgi:hypothetical protein